MSEVSVIPEAVEAFGATSAALGSATAAAGAIDTAVSAAVLTGVFGLVGQEFLAAYLLAQANHLAGVGQLAAVHTATAVTAGVALADFHGSDAAGAGDLAAR